MIRKADIVLTVILIITGLILSWSLSFGNSAGRDLVITSEGKLYGTYPLGEDRTIQIDHDGHHNTVTIQDGEVRMTSADCPGLDCVHSRAIKLSGETIVCLPNRVLLEIEGGKEAYDSISR